MRIFTIIKNSSCYRPKSADYHYLPPRTGLHEPQLRAMVSAGFNSTFHLIYTNIIKCAYLGEYSMPALTIGDVSYFNFFIPTIISKIKAGCKNHFTISKVGYF